MIKRTRTPTAVRAKKISAAFFGAIVALACRLAAGEVSQEQSIQPPASWIGKQVVTKYSAPVRAEHQKAESGRIFRVYTVEKVDGDRVRLASGSTSGWIASTEVVLLDEAIDFYSQEMRTQPNSAAAYHERGSIWKFRGEADKALADLTEAIRLDPKDASSHVDRGGIFLDRKDNDQAIADFTEAIRLDPKYVLAYANRGYAWSNKQDND